MRRNLPPLTAVRAFEAAARRLSISRAAEELHVTPPAISHQIRALEEWLGMRLFWRNSGVLELTPAGHTYLFRVSEAFNQLWEATDQISIKDANRTLSVVVPPSIATKWLIPRLGRFKERHPDLELRVQIFSPPIDFSQHFVDIGISFGWSVGEGLHREPWMSYDIIAVASPELVKGDPPLREPSDLCRHTLLHDEALKIHDRVDWRSWLEHFGVGEIETLPEIRFNLAAQTYQMAVERGGVALAKSPLVNLDIAAGRLLALFDYSMPSEFSYDVIIPEPLIGNPRVIAFRDWLFEEVKKDGTSARARSTHRSDLD